MTLMGDNRLPTEMKKYVQRNSYSNNPNHNQIANQQSIQMIIKGT